jgi:hypothetical protein
MRILGLFLVVLPHVAVGAEPLLQWQPHDLAFTATREHPWWEFPVRAAFHREGARDPQLTVEGFWDGGNAWVVRVALPSAGRWTWHTQSADPGMHDRRGEISVAAPNAEQLAANPNLRGSLRVAADRRHFEHADGTPFFLLASTLWAANTARCGLGANQDGPFYQHLADRKSKGFTTILMQYFHGYGDYPDSPGHRNEGGKPYLEDDRAKLNPLHFQALDTRLDALWREGFVAAIPTTWWGKTKRCVFTVEDARRMSTYCAVRYGAFNAIWSLSGEYQYAFKDCGWMPANFTALGEAVQQHNPYHRPLSIHPSGQITWPPPHNVQSSLPFHGQSWLDHHWLQTGQSRDRMFNIVTRLAENRALTAPVPVFCSEAFYEQASDEDRAYHTRWQVWSAFLNGAAGFGYGAQGLWQFFDPADAEGETGKQTGREVPWREAQQFAGSAQIIHARNLLTKLDWWTLTPARDRLLVDGKRNPLTTGTDLSPPQAAVVGGDTWIVYLPRENSTRSIALSVERERDWSIRWIDPRTGAETPATIAKSQQGTILLPSRPSPAAEDWVSLLE